MKLYLMRHGEALSPEKDPERGLTDNGKSKIKQVATHLQKAGVSFTRVIHSPKKRARETAEIMTAIISANVIPVEHNHIAPNDDPRLIIAEINDWDEDTLIASHLPFVPNLMTLLTGQDTYLSAISFETGTVVCLERNDKNSWDVKWSTSPGEI
ncbi:MAG: phosphohistidine phosphatase SixA [Gammaproteobacteria bacterium]|nr:phosphohistidine phosphatase SixA [Gammaproteobacteria bacterium]MCW8986505.1 phosphohistidine phosphatase SixA [Gammaproteobacteria bacterium]MCW9030962.1 phosphohistidine phosphatase SixA [Gammaproteobacteria bacterium]